jgi:uncharacterized membrane protein YeaQ/YmgE (transglycosylase-associated protein family)
MGSEWQDASVWIQHKGANGGGMMSVLAAILQGQTTVSYDIRTIWVNSTHGLLWWIIVGLLAGKLARGRGFGCIGDVVLGLIGSVLGGWIFEHLGIVHANTFLYSLAAATVGAVILVSIAHLFFGGKNG